MKTKKFLFMAAGIALLTGACSKKPAEVANDIYNSANKMEFSNILPYIIPDSVAPFTDQEKQTFEQYLSETYYQGIGEKMPLYSSYTVECEEPDKDATEASFTVTTQFPDGISYKEKGTLLKGKDGKWRIGFAKDYSDTTTYYSVSDSQKKTPELMRNLEYAYVMTMATRGLPEYQVLAAIYYDDGIMTSKDTEKYFELIKNAADKDYPEAIRKVGSAYYFGKELGAEKDYDKAFQYWKKAAEMGNPNAMQNLGFAYEEGVGTMKDSSLAAQWYKKGVEAGDIRSLNNLALLYEEGNGVEKDNKKAFDLYLEAAQKGDLNAMNNLSWCYQDGKGVDKDINKAIEWATKAAEGGNISGMLHLADINYNGDGGAPKNEGRAFNWYLKAADKGNLYGMYMVGQCYEFGRGTDVNRSAAKEWYRKAWNRNYQPAGQALLRF